MKLPRKVLWGMGVALTFVVVTPASAGWNIYDIGKYPRTPPASEGTAAPQDLFEESLDEESVEEALNDLPQDDGGEGTSGTGVDDLLLDTRSLPNDPVDDPGPIGGSQMTQVPEPGTLALLTLGLGALGFGRRRRLTK
jgi:hypothetical protein